MMHVPIDLPAERISSDVLIVEAARCWRRARDAKMAVMPKVHALACAKGWPMLAPVLDSLMHLFEDSLSRPFEMGRSKTLSADERLLAGLTREARGFATPLACAFCSMRLVLDRG